MFQKRDEAVHLETASARYAQRYALQNSALSVLQNCKKSIDTDEIV
jgi:hypothetical protein